MEYETKTVGDLIAFLQTLPKDAVLAYDDPDCGELTGDFWTVKAISHDEVSAWEFESREIGYPTVVKVKRKAIVLNFDL